MVLALSSAAAAQLGALFEQRLVQKRYLLVTDRPLPSRFAFGYQSLIKKTRGRLVSWAWARGQHDFKPNAFTVFYPVARVAPYSCVEVELLSGKSHQIRLHAKDLGFPLLGDSDHGGAKFPRLMLHATSISWPATHGLEAARWHVPAPAPFMELELCRDVSQAGTLLADSMLEPDGHC